MFAAVFGAWAVLNLKRPPLRHVQASPRPGLPLKPELEYINF